MDYASLFGIHNHWAPWVFAAIYTLLFFYFLTRSMSIVTGIYGDLAFFAIMRVAAFVLRGIMADFARFRTNRGIGISYDVLFNVGFFALLLAAYDLMHNRERFARLNRSVFRPMMFFHRGRIVHFIVFIGFALGLAGFVLFDMGNHTKLGRDLEDAMVYIYMAVAVIILLLCFMVMVLERRLRRSGAIYPTGYLPHHAILLLIALLIFGRMVYFTITTAQARRRPDQSNEKFWYPLAALFELLAALLFCVPGLAIAQSLFVRHRAGAPAYV